MTPEFWQERWQAHEIGFHEGKPNELLTKHVAKLEWRKPLRLLVPLCGKAFDLRWLSERGHDVVGIEVVPQAIKEFFDDWKKPATAHRLGAHEAFYASGVTLVNANIFDVSQDTLGTFDAIYDRAALVALDPKDRQRYVSTCQNLLNPKGGTFLISFDYDQSKRPGPPWSIDSAEVTRLFGHADLLEQNPRPVSPAMQSAGIESMNEAAYWVSR